MLTYSCKWLKLNNFHKYLYLSCRSDRLFDLCLRLGLAHPWQSRNVGSRPGRHLLQRNCIYRPQSDGLFRLFDDWLLIGPLIPSAAADPPRIKQKKLDSWKLIHFSILIKTSTLILKFLCAVCYYFIFNFNFPVTWYFLLHQSDSNIKEPIHRSQSTCVEYLIVGPSDTWTGADAIG